MVRTIKTCASIAKEDLQSLVRGTEKALASGANYVEARLDALSPSDLTSALLTDAFTPFKEKLVLTLRSKGQGGKSSEDVGDAALVLDLLRDIHPLFLDIEFNLAMERPALVLDTQASGVLVLISHHDLSGTPPTQELIEILREMREYSPWVKLVTTANSPEDGERIVGLYRSGMSLFHSTKLISFAMGEQGKISRFASGLLGPFTYVALDKATAPGQPTLEEVQEFNEKLPFYDEVLGLVN